MLRRLARLPLDDYLAALGVFFDRFTPLHALALVLSAGASWWVYVPLHELAHAWGCQLGGGSVSTLEIDAIYGAAWLQRLFPYVSVGSDYAGRLSGFDTHGSDATYLLTDLLPFVATVVVGVPALRAAADPRRGGLAQALLFGAALPVAFAPFISLTGDFYEVGSILVSRAVAVLQSGFDPTRWRADDLPKLIGERFAAGAGGSVAEALGIGAALALGSALAWLTYAAGAAVSSLLGIAGARPTTDPLRTTLPAA
ncbi:MAG: hypothetical protein SF182_20705 [Deltaproteobacteria bacterium]|nr:hypothetical protein [Deltaproteobacteria bacterium]